MFASLVTIIRGYFTVCLFRSGPRDMPAAGVFFLFSVLLYAIGSLVLVVPFRSLPVAILTGLVDTGLLLLLTYGLLSFRNLEARFFQTGAALTGTGFLFSLFALPLFSLQAALGDDSAAVPVLALLLLGLMAWNIAVMAHILRQAITTSFAVGVLLAIGYAWFITTAMMLVLPAETAS